MEKISLREFIDRREAEIKEVRAALLVELKELKAARLAISGNQVLGAPANTQKSQLVDDDENTDKTIKEMVLEVLSLHDGSGTSDEISSWISLYFGKQFERSSISPQLSRLKRDDKLRYFDQTKEWAIPSVKNPEDFSENSGTRSLDAVDDFGDIV